MDKRSGNPPGSLLTPLTGYHYEFTLDCSLEDYVQALRDQIAGTPLLAIKLQSEDKDCYRFVVQSGGPSRSSTGYLKAISASETLVSGKMERDRISIYVLLGVITLFFVRELTSPQPFSLGDLMFIIIAGVVLYLALVAGYRSWTRQVARALREVY